MEGAMTIDWHNRRTIAQRSGRARAARRYFHLALTASAFTCLAAPSGAQDVLPSDVKPTCIVEPADFSRWFEDGSVRQDGLASPADSLNFRHNGLACPFFQWAQRMFYWVTSPVKGEERVFQSSDFFMVSEPDADGNRTMMPQPTKLQTFLRAAKTLEGSGQPGRRGVLMAQNGSLVYYANSVNDAFAYFVTGAKNGVIPGPTRPLQFPIYRDEINAVEGVAASNPGGARRLSHKDALVVQLKSAWIEVTPGLDSNKFITMRAEIPVYEVLDQKTWKATGRMREAQLALVGLHVVGSVQGFSRLLWATFEHVDNSPVARYKYQPIEG